MVLCMVLHMVFGVRWFSALGIFVDLVKGTTVMFRSRVNGLGFMYSSSCIYMCCNTQRNIMKNQVGRPNFGSRGNICVYLFYVLCSHYCLFSILRFVCR